MRTSTKIIAIACAAATGPLLATAAISIRDYISAPAEETEKGFSLEGAFIGSGDGSGTTRSPYDIVVCGNCDDGGGGVGDWEWWRPGGDSGYGDGSSSGGTGGPPEPERCSLGDGDVRIEFDGRTIRVTAGYTMTGPGAASSEAYIAGIERYWTVDFPEVGIGIVTDLVPDPNGFVFRVDDDYHAREHLQPVPGGNWEIRLGSLVGWESLLDFKLRVGAHEFGHFWVRGGNLPASAGGISIMTDAYVGRVLPSDLMYLAHYCMQQG